MKLISRIMGAGLLLALTATTVQAQTIEQLQASAKELAGTDWPGTYLRLCINTIQANQQVAPTFPPANFPDIDLPTPAGGSPPRQNWYAEPAQVGDNFFFLGERAHNSFALVANTGEIIILDGLFEYATDAEIHQGLRMLGLDPQMVRYQIIAHNHGDHDGGAHLTQALIPGMTLIYGEADWPAVLARTGPHATRAGPQNDGTDGRVIRVGDVSVEIVTMPGHTPGTLSFLFEFKDNGKPVRVAYVGGTAISFTGNAAYYDGYLASSVKFARAAAGYGADALMSNHTEFDNGYFRSHTAANRYALNVRNPYQVGQRAVMSYFGVVELCTKAAKLRATGSLATTAEKGTPRPRKQD